MLCCVITWLEESRMWAFPTSGILVVPEATSTIRRRRRTIGSLFAEYGPYYARRAYRMTPQSLLQLYKLLRPYMGEKKRKHGVAVTPRLRGRFQPLPTHPMPGRRVHQQHAWTLELTVDNRKRPTNKTKNKLCTKEKQTKNYFPSNEKK